ncbi:type IX secretion system PorP/SprF family membrane protein [Flavobacteriaceae bacterium MAR_2010_72]|nr:type IX secretion system PorP/SprF family membrane protein [Flavobacteriaceae bacterium MAR_2010_72]
MIYKLQIEKVLLIVFAVFTVGSSLAQQDPQYTQYMYNTMSINPGYTGQRDTLSVVALYRTQWVGIDGAPKTQTLGAHMPLKNKKIGLGLSIVNDKLGPATETFFNGNFSYTINVSENNTKLSFGVNGGFHLLNTDWSKGRFKNPDVAFNENVNLVSPIIGAGLYLRSEKWYLGLSVPNFITTNHYDDYQESLATERLHYYFIGGYVFDLSKSTKFKPALLVKAVSGSPIIADVSANFLFNKKITLGLAYRWDDSLAGIVGFQISNEIYLGYAYDYTTTNLNNYNSGTHEIMLRYELQSLGKLLSPRFF